MWAQSPTVAFLRGVRVDIHLPGGLGKLRNEKDISLPEWGVLLIIRRY